jgi:flagellar biosynthesis protein FliQ
MAVEISQILTGLADSTVSFLPNLVAAIILLVIGLVVGKIVGRVVKEILLRIKLDYYVTETHKPPVSLTDIFSLITRWWIYLTFIAAALSREILGVTTLSVWMTQISDFIPSIIGAALIVIVGYVIGEYIKTQLRKSGKPYSALAGKLILFFTLYVSIALALPLLGVNTVLVNNILLIIIGAVAFAFALAFGLGGREVASDIMKKWARKANL